MGISRAFESTEFPSILNIILEALTAKILFIVGIDFLILILCIYVFLKSSKSILKRYNTQEIQRNEKFHLHSILGDLSARADVKTPKIYSFDSEVPKIFTVGNGREYSIAISTSMLKMFDEIELESLLAHEIGHIKNGDVILNTITAFLAGTIMSFPNFAMWCSMLSGFGRQDDPAPKLFKVMATGIAAPSAAILVHLTNPAKREFAADEVALKLTKNPQVLAKTLEFLENYISLQPVINEFNPGHFHLFSTHTQQVRGDLAIFIYMFDTHPEIEDRVARILSHSTDTKNDDLDNKYARVPGFFDLKKWKIAIGISFVSWIMPLFLIIVFVIFAMGDFNLLIIGGIAGAYTCAVIFLISITVKISMGKLDRKSYLRIRK